MNRPALLLVLVLAGIALRPAPAHACACAGGPPESWPGRADAIFLGRPQAHRLSLLPPRQEIFTRFEVDSVWKGDVGRRVVLVTDHSSCGGHFPPDEAYLVFATRDHRGRLTTWSCSGTGIARYSQSAFAVLGPGSPPAARWWHPTSRAVVGAFAGLVGLLLLGLFTALRPRRSSLKHTESERRA